MKKQSLNFLIHHLDDEPHHALFVAIFLGNHLSNPPHLVPLCHQSLIFVIYGQIMDVCITYPIAMQSSQYGQIIAYQFVYFHNVALSVITWTCRCPSLMSCTLTTGLGSIATPLANALASISSPCTVCAVLVAWIGTPPPN